LSGRLQGIVVITVVVVWAALTVGSFVSPTHTVPTTVDTIMGIIAGGAVANEVVRRATKRAENHKERENEPVRSVQDEALRRGRKQKEES
jgi:hypothetical protein